MLNDLPPSDDYADLEIVTDLRHCLSGIVGMHTMPIIGALDSAAIRTDPAYERHAYRRARGYPIIRRAHQVARRYPRDTSPSRSSSSALNRTSAAAAFDRACAAVLTPGIGTTRWSRSNQASAT